MGTDRESRMVPITGLDAIELRDRIARGEISALAATEACLEVIGRREPEIRAWAWHDPEFARAQARALDQYRASGRPLGALHGLPVGIKDIIDTRGIPTENGAALDKGRVPGADAFVVERLKAAGAVTMGKTKTTELAYLHPTDTRNPHDTAHTPGGSSSGSAAAVAAGMVPLAIGTQTGGSVIRPASFCGVTGFKPSFGAIPRRGVLMQSQTLDTVGVFARSPAEAAMLADELFGHDPSDPATMPAAAPGLLQMARARPPVKPAFAFVRPPGWNDADPQMREAVEEAAHRLGEQCFEVDLPPQFAQAAELRQRINFAEMSRCYYRYARDGQEMLGLETRAALEEGARITARDYLAALDWREVLNAGLSEIFLRCDAILAPAATGPAPHGLETTGSAIFNGLWTLCGTPAVTIPIFETEGGMPMGLQLVGPRGGDGRLLRTAQWALTELTGGEA
jgi:Asp-tRNA(Asn)/Glu-tRNA(Gln) amidotransferase A subunit family amidase